MKSIDDATQIDLSSVDFVLPGGIVAVACSARSALERGEQITVVAPDRDDVARYASRMGLSDVLANCGAESVLPPVRRHEQGHVLVDCQWADDSAVEGLSIMVSDRLWAASVDAEIIDLVDMSVYEVADNVRTHAGSGGGFICAQTYKRGTPEERIEVALGDTGRGIRASLEARYSPLDDQDALRLATKESVTGLPQERRGLGLHYLARDIPRVGGRFTLRSGGAYLRVFPGGPYSAQSEPIVGTLVEICVPVGGLTKGEHS